MEIKYFKMKFNLLNVNYVTKCVYFKKINIKISFQKRTSEDRPLICLKKYVIDLFL